MKKWSKVNKIEQKTQKKQKNGKKNRFFDEFLQIQNSVNVIVFVFNKTDFAFFKKDCKQKPKSRKQNQDINND